MLGVVFELQQPFHGDLVEHIYAAAARHGYEVVISAVAPSREESTAVNALLRERCEAPILLGSPAARRGAGTPGPPAAGSSRRPSQRTAGRGFGAR
ncbi:hypothetical protein ACFV2H_19330 [Streptomyces sp. NPDC059629]|uniref:hypothetical protein n=1 Tax=Streptomyces sp. NPDC059629 TaxID=3346889 RepID=UPI003693175F